MFEYSNIRFDYEYSNAILVFEYSIFFNITVLSSKKTVGLKLLELSVIKMRQYRPIDHLQVGKYSPFKNNTNINWSFVLNVKQGVNICLSA